MIFSLSSATNNGHSAIQYIQYLHVTRRFHHGVKKIPANGTALDLDNINPRPMLQFRQDPS
jgi:hypothetical protein